jgi:hypothetical protein
MFAACQPILLLSVRPQDGGSVTHPKLLMYGLGGRGGFVHGVQWPNHGTDAFALVGGETNGTPRCDQTVSLPAVLATWVRSGPSTLRELGEFTLHDGTYTDGNPPAHTLGCSVHWFHPHPTFHNGGLVSLAAYDNGNRFVRVKPDGSITEVGWFNRPNASTWASYWAPDQRTVYVVDDYRGFDVIRYTGDLYAGSAGSAVAGSSATGGGTGGSPEAAGSATTPNTAASGAATGVGAAAVALLLSLRLSARRRAGRRRSHRRLRTQSTDPTREV